MTPTRAFASPCLVLLAGFLGWLQGAYAQDIDEVCTAHVAARQSIHTFSCKITVNHTARGPLSFLAGEYWRSDDRVRVKWRMPDKQYDSLLLDGQVRSVVQSRDHRGKTVVGATIVRDTGQPMGLCDPWFLGLLTFPSAEDVAVFRPLEQLLAQPHTLHRIGSATADGNDYVVVGLEHALSRQELWFDPRANYLVAKAFLYPTTKAPGQGQLVTQTQVTHFSEAVPSIFFPDGVTIKVTGSKGTVATSTARFTNVVINAPLPASVFRLPFPPGILVLDGVQGKKYTTDGQGKPVPASVEELPAGTALPAGVIRRSETTYEAVGWSGWVLPASCLLVVVAGASLVWRRYRACRFDRGNAHGEGVDT
jgi:hypothetical protein